MQPHQPLPPAQVHLLSPGMWVQAFLAKNLGLLGVTLGCSAVPWGGREDTL